MNVRGMRTLGGLSAAIVPCAIVVHVGAELAAGGRETLGLAFVVRHAYFAVLFAAAVGWFSSTVGLRATPRERRRRCALLRAGLAGRARGASFASLVVANAIFFGLTQAVEGMPVLSGGAMLGLAVALAGSLLSALLVFAFGRSLACAGLAVAIGIAPPPHRAARFVVQRTRFGAPARRPSFSYSLFVPNRPPPFVPVL